MKIKKEDIEKLFETCEHQQDVLVGIYKLVYPEWDDIEKIDGWPTCNKKTWGVVMDMFRPFDKIHHPDVMAGGAWFDSGFSTSDGEDLEDWQVRKAPFTLKVLAA